MIQTNELIQGNTGFQDDTSFLRESEVETHINKLVRTADKMANSRGRGKEYGVISNPYGLVSSVTTLHDTEYGMFKENKDSCIILSDKAQNKVRYNTLLSDAGVNKEKPQIVRYNSSYNPTGAETGMLQQINTLTAIKQKIVQQKFYETNLADYAPVVTGFGAFSSSINTWKEFFGTDPNDDSSYVQSGYGKKRKSVKPVVTMVSVPTYKYIVEMEYDIFEVKESALVVYNYIERVEQVALKHYQLQTQAVFFTGKMNDNQCLGLLNLDDNTNNQVITIDTTTIPTLISTMGVDAYATFIASVLTAFDNVSFSTEVPDTFVIPRADWLGLGGFVSATYPVNSRLKTLLEMFQTMTNNPNFKILPSPYFNSTNPRNQTGNNRYALYCNREDVLEFNIPVPYTSTSFLSYNGFDFQSVGYAQIAGMNLLRDRAFMYFENTPAL